MTTGIDSPYPAPQLIFHNRKYDSQHKIHRGQNQSDDSHNNTADTPVRTGNNDPGDCNREAE